MEEQKMDVAVVEQKVGGMQKMVIETLVTSPEELAAVADKIKNIKALGRLIRAEMEKYTRPAMEIVRNAQAKFLPYEKACKDAESQLKNKAEIYMAEEEAKRKKKEDVIAKQVETGRFKEETGLRKMEELGEEKKSVDTGAATLTRKMVKVAEITDPNLIPDEYWVIDEARVKKAAIAGAVIPGVTVKEVAQMAIR